MEKLNAENNLIALLKDEKSRKEGIAALIKTYQMPLYWHIRKLVVNHDDSKDVLQEVFLRVWRSIDQFKGDSKLFTWLFRIATNESLRFNERKQKQLKNQMSLQEMLEKEMETSPFISGEEIQIALQKAIFKLTEKQRLVFNMHYFDELDYSDIAEILETTANNVKVLYHYAKNSIEAELKSEL
jgi:RNA polymerase sigma-70 factor (ECF subfamily)